MVKSAIRGKRGQAFLKEMAAVLDAMPDKYLAPESLRTEEGEVCAIGSVLVARGMSPEQIAKIDPDESEVVANIAGIAECLAREIMYENDEAVWRHDDPDAGFKRWRWMRNWVEKNLKGEKA
jgi:CBS domain containing-hemolysin-like protein